MTAATPRRPLSTSQDRVLRALCKFIREFRRQPSYRELGELLGTSSVPRVIEQLEAKGWIRRSGSGSARSIEIPEDVYEDIAGSGESE